MNRTKSPQNNVASIWIQQNYIENRKYYEKLIKVSDVYCFYEHAGDKQEPTHIENSEVERRPS